MSDTPIFDTLRRERNFHWREATHETHAKRGGDNGAQPEISYGAAQNIVPSGALVNHLFLRSETAMALADDLRRENGELQRLLDLQQREIGRLNRKAEETRQNLDAFGATSKAEALYELLDDFPQPGEAHYQGLTREQNEGAAYAIDRAREEIRKRAKDYTARSSDSWTGTSFKDS